MLNEHIFFGVSKHAIKQQRIKESKENNTPYKPIKGIFSKTTLKTYQKACEQFSTYLRTKHPEVKRFENGKPYIEEWLESLKDSHSAWTLATSLSYYATATNQALQEQMQTYLKKQSILINNIGKIDNLVIEDYKNAIPLCNGWCCKPPELGVYEKINACLNCSQFNPSSQFLLNYKLQLSDVEAGLSIAVANNYTRMIEKYESQKESLEKIISELESRTYEQKT